MQTQPNGMGKDNLKGALLSAVYEAIKVGDKANDRRFGRSDAVQDAIGCLHDARRVLER